MSSGSRRSRPGEMKRHAEDKGKGLFSPDDWTCKNCHNINWARRTTCNVCNTPRFNNAGERTGYGGGFMERDEVVEYRRGSESDEEFDEFGRKKKRFRNANAVPEAAAAASTIDREQVPENKDDQDDVTNAEDEEESGDDADLSKYAIWSGDEDEVEDTGKKTGNGAVASSSDSDSDSSSSSSSSSASSRSSAGSRSSSSDGGHSQPVSDAQRESAGLNRSRFEPAVL